MLKPFQAVDSLKAAKLGANCASRNLVSWLKSDFSPSKLETVECMSSGDEDSFTRSSAMMRFLSSACFGFSFRLKPVGLNLLFCASRRVFSAAPKQFGQSMSSGSPMW